MIIDNLPNKTDKISIIICNYNSKNKIIRNILIRLVLIYILSNIRIEYNRITSCLVQY